ncbi:MAG: NAD(P)H-dependent oxidoreductase [Verrucomicrobia bacterium]|nr:NAD(P)H-dependent oxidoreductase [Verrucomicrobiota bacterium]MBI3868314.1 NAD(P)H-dependent oxidoreductase [Verrucomicrobiota bacterium]
MTPRPVSTDTLLTQLRWRYATKQFDSTRKISADDWRALEEALLLTPSSFGLQPWRFIVVTDQATKEKLVPVSWGQRQVADASHVVVFAISRSLGATDVDRYLGRIAAVRGVTPESLKGFRDMLLGFVAQPADQFNPQNWSARQVYIALGNFLTSAALVGIDACPMEGIEPERYDEILGLREQGYQTVVVAPAGYRASNDKYASLPKVRYAAEEVITHVG